MILGLLAAAFAPARAQIPAVEPPSPAALFTRQCGTCHSIVPGEKRQGPNLAGVYGRKAGSVEGYKCSPGFATVDFAWDEEHLDPYLTNPKSVIPGGVMAYRQANPDVRRTIIGYLKEKS